MSAAIAGVEMKSSPTTFCVDAPTSSGAVSPNRRRNRGPAGRNLAAGDIDRSSWSASGSRKTR
jgi:hypothetical protein